MQHYGHRSPFPMPGRTPRSFPEIFSLHHTQMFKWEDSEPPLILIFRRWALPLIGGALSVWADTTSSYCEGWGVFWLLAWFLDPFGEALLTWIAELQKVNTTGFLVAQVMFQCLMLFQSYIGERSWYSWETIILFGLAECGIFRKTDRFMFIVYTCCVFMALFTTRPITSFNTNRWIRLIIRAVLVSVLRSFLKVIVPSWLPQYTYIFEEGMEPSFSI